ncbi:MAG: YtxH domain-containing protein [Chloroflexota bacterium]|nr:YtxH domain-containing protein [Chloroflexota bacterium]
MGKLFRFIVGGVIGAAVGAAGAVLFTPQSGQELQQRFNARRQEALAAYRAEMEARERVLRVDLQARLDKQSIQRHALRD